VRISGKFLHPPAYLLLHSLKGEKFFNARLGVRHPLGVFNVAFARVVQRLRRTIDDSMLIYKIQPHFRPENQQYLDSLELFYHSCAEFFDSCGLIIKSFFESPQEEKASEACREFFSNKYKKNTEEEYQKSINSIKHNHARIRAMICAINGFWIPGFFIERFRDDGSIGPDPNIHAMGDTAFSCTRFIKKSFQDILEYCSMMEQKIDKIIKEKNILKANNVGTMEGNDNFEYLIKEIIQIPNIVFINEMNHDYPLIQYAEKEDSKNLTIETVKMAGAFEWTGVEVGYVGDGISTSFKLPYIEHYLQGVITR
jgi:hypothetical protein